MTSTERYGAGKIVVREYDPAWPEMFAEEEAQIAAALGPMVLSVEHVGSTSVPGLPAKPIIDMLVTVRDMPEARQCAVQPLIDLGYVYYPEYEQWLPDEMFFRKGPPGPWTHHVHVADATSPRWEEFILIRDFLRQRPEFAHAYGDLKKAVALLFEDDFVGYREAKRPFLKALLDKARTEANPDLSLGILTQGQRTGGDDPVAGAVAAD
ncbi:MAG TPA: GrpB family protein [Chloroflexota bacterium]|nr:GrpB family protein [Chloroflexota bacterium]